MPVNSFKSLLEKSCCSECYTCAAKLIEILLITVPHSDEEITEVKIKAGSKVIIKIANLDEV